MGLADPPWKEGAWPRPLSEVAVWGRVGPRGQRGLSCQRTAVTSSPSEAIPAPPPHGAPRTSHPISPARAPDPRSAMRGVAVMLKPPCSSICTSYLEFCGRSPVCFLSLLSVWPPGSLLSHPLRRGPGAPPSGLLGPAPFCWHFLPRWLSRFCRRGPVCPPLPAAGPKQATPPGKQGLGVGRTRGLCAFSGDRAGMQVCVQRP